MPILTCEWCKETVYFSSHRFSKSRRFCGMICYNAARQAGWFKRVEHARTNCIVCGKLIILPPCRPKRHANAGRYCSRVCQGKATFPAMNARRRPPKEYARPPVMSGPANPKWVPPVVLTCEHCQRQFERKPWQLKHGISRYCSAACRDAYRRLHEAGKNSPFWVGGPKTYRGRGWKQIRVVVVAEQGGCCAHCGKHVGASLPVNHIRPFREFATAEEANARPNLVGLCQPCHMRAEPRRTRQSSTP